MDRIKIFIYFFVSGVFYIFPVTAISYVVDLNWQKHPWMIVVIPLVVGTLSGVWANIFKGSSFGKKKGILTALISYLSFIGLFSIYLEGFNVRAIEAFIGYTFFLGVGTLFIIFWVAPVGWITGMMYMESSNKSLKDRDALKRAT